MTILLQQPPTDAPYLLIKPKQTLRKGDTIIFQTEVTDNHGGTGVDETKKVVETASAPETEGLMKGWQLLTWVEESI